MQLLSNRDLQRLFAFHGAYVYGIDGDIGPKTLAAVDKVIAESQLNIPPNLSDHRRLIAAAQIVLTDGGHEPGEIDGYVGHNTLEAFNSWDYQRIHVKPEHVADRELDDLPRTNGKVTEWPYQHAVERFYGPVGSNQTRIDLPYGMCLAWDTDTIITSMTCHEKVADATLKIFERTIDYYGLDELMRLRLHYFGGSLNVRKMRGGSEMSLHSWGIAFDLDPANNRLRWGRDRAKFAGVEYLPFWRIVADAGATSLGVSRNFDWMHFQFANL